jgi:hypothetical protein
MHGAFIADVTDDRTFGIGQAHSHLCWMLQNSSGVVRRTGALGTIPGQAKVCGLIERAQSAVGANGGVDPEEIVKSNKINKQCGIQLASPQLCKPYC